MKVGRRSIDISNRDKVFFPDVGVTKGDLIAYYSGVADIMLPHLKRYGVSMERYPDGLSGEGFYNKDAPDYFPDWIHTVKFPKREGGSFNAPIIDSRATLIYLADQAMITPHPYLARSDNLEHPDKMVYDLDPPEGERDFHAVREAAMDLRDVMRELDLTPWVQTTGSKGFHVVVALNQDEDFDSVRRFAHDLALLLVRRHEDKYTLEQRKKKRKGRIFLDVLRNSYGATAVAPYAVRARPGATVATPLDWEEVERSASPRGWTLKSIPRRLDQKGDPWSGLMRHAQSLGNRSDALESMLDQEEPAQEELD